VWLLTSFRPATADELAAVHAALAARWQQLAPGQPLNWVHQCRHEGKTHTQVMAGSVPEPHDVSEDGLRYAVHLLKGQNHGLFLDMAEGRRWLRTQVASLAAHAAQTPGSRAPRLLNLFAYTCAFSVVALAAGAREVVNLDMSRGALATGQHNHRLNGVDAGARFLGHDLFSSWGKVGRGGPYDLVIVDPPSYQLGSFVATKDYPRLLRRLPDLLMPGGHALLCLNAPELDTAFLHGALQAQAPGLQVVQRLPNPPAFADAAPERALKVLVCQAPG
jgi:23S rRNA (cytosine1962-C5)-methyltransferase